MVVEDQPCFSIKQLQALEEWPLWAEKKAAKIAVVLDGTMFHASVQLDSTALNFGWRWWVICPSCAARRYTLLGVGTRICCRGCAGGKGKGLLYLQQSWDRRYREELGLPILKAWRQLQRREDPVSSSLSCA